jgi:hypothetical protein
VGRSPEVQANLNDFGYITDQQEHHQRRDFQGEFIAFLKKHHVEYDPRYVWG